MFLTGQRWLRNACPFFLFFSLLCMGGCTPMIRKDMIGVTFTLSQAGEQFYNVPTEHKIKNGWYKHKKHPHYKCYVLNGEIVAKVWAGRNVGWWWRIYPYRMSIRNHPIQGVESTEADATNMALKKLYERYYM